MHKLFKKHYEVFFQRAFRLKETPDKIHAEINKFKKNNDFKDGEILHRFPKKELRYFVRSECPTERLPGKKEIKSYEVIKASKRLRNFMNIPEHFTCSRCTKRETCKFKDIVPPSKNTSVSDLLVMLNGLHNYESVVYQEKTPKQAEEGQLAEEGDEQDVGATAREELLAELKEEEELEEDEEEIAESEGSEGEEEDALNEGEQTVQLEDRYTHKTWDSALKLVDTLYPVVEDIRYRKGSGCKQFINTYITENKKLVGAKNQALEGSEDEDGETIQAPRHQGKYQRNENQMNRRREKRQFQKESGDVAWGTKPERAERAASDEKPSRPSRAPRRVVEEQEEEEEEEHDFDGQEEEEVEEDESEFIRRPSQKKFGNRGQDRGNQQFDQNNKGSYQNKPRRQYNEDFEGEPRRSYQNKPRRQYNADAEEGTRGSYQNKPRRQYNEDFEGEPRRSYQNKPRRQYNADAEENSRGRPDRRYNKNDRGARSEGAPYRNKGQRQEGRDASYEDRGNRKSFRGRENNQSDIRDRNPESKNFKLGERVSKDRAGKYQKGQNEGKMDLSSFMNDIKH